jgi:hypothetical protein
MMNTNLEERKMLAWQKFLTVYDFSDRWLVEDEIAFCLFLGVWCVMIIGALL